MTEENDQERQQRCASPPCSLPATRTYADAHGNEVELCRKCYYRQVTQGPQYGLSSGVEPDRITDHLERNSL